MYSACSLAVKMHTHAQMIRTFIESNNKCIHVNYYVNVCFVSSWSYII